ncbi:MAG: DUF3261 domain-containing protein [bacterium]
MIKILPSAATFLCLLLLLQNGCGPGRIPFQTVSYVPFEGVDPGTVRERFARLIPDTFQVVDTIVFTYGRHTFSAIGYTALDSRQKAFTVAGMNPMGVKLFELAADKKSVECRFALEEFTRHGNFAQAVADDIRRIYFDRVPVPEARVKKEKYRIIFSQPDEEGTIEYIFAGADSLLVEKRCCKQNRRLWSISYYEYQQKDGKLYPGGIIFNHHQRHYQFIVRLKEIRS